MCIFILVAVKARTESFVQDLMTKSAANLPSVAVGDERNSPFRYPCSVDKTSGQEETSRNGTQSHNCTIVDSGCNLVLGMEGKDSYTTDSIRVNS